MIDGFEASEIEVGGGRVLGVQVAGAGTPVVLVHGIPKVDGLYDAVATRLSASHRVVVVDLLGFGRSSRPTEPSAIWLDAQADALAACLRALGLGPVTLVGHDYGAPTAVTLVDRAPELVGALVLIAGNLRGDTPVPFPLSTVYWPVLGAAARAALFSGPSLRMLMGRAGAPKGAGIGDPGEVRSAATIFWTALDGLAARYAAVQAALGRIAVPTAVLWGSDDPLFPLEQGRRAAELVPGVDFRVLDGRKHLLPLEDPERVAEAVLATAARA